MLPIGALINASAVVIGGAAGLALGRRLSEDVRACIFQGLGLAVLAIGIKLSFKTASPVILVGSIVCGGMLGGALRLEHRLANVGLWLKAKLRSNNPRFADGLTLALTVFCFGSLALLGPLDEGVRGDHTLLYTKAFLDGLTAVAFASVYGAGVLLSAIPLLVYEAATTFLASVLGQNIAPAVVTELSAVGGVITIGIGINMLEIKHIALPNMLPALLFTGIFASLWL